MSHSDEPATLRRRARELLSTGHDEQYVQVLLRAADELVVRRKCATESEQTAVHAIADVRRLMKCLSQLAGVIERSTMARDQKQICAGILRSASAVKEIGTQRRLLAVAVLDGETRLQTMERFTELYDVTFGGDDASKVIPAAEDQEAFERAIEEARPEGRPAGGDRGSGSDPAP